MQVHIGTQSCQNITPSIMSEHIQSYHISQAYAGWYTVVGRSASKCKDDNLYILKTVFTKCVCERMGCVDWGEGRGRHWHSDEHALSTSYITL